MSAPTTTAPFGDPAQVGVLLNDPEFDLPRATLALATVSDYIRGFLAQTITPVTDDVIEVTSDIDQLHRYLPSMTPRTVFLRELPVTAVSMVEQLNADQVTWEPLAPTEYTWTGNGVLSFNPSRPVSYQSGSWAPVSIRTRVTYSHGYEPVPGDVIGVALVAAARLYANPQGLMIERLGQRLVNYGKTGLITDLEADVLSRFAVARWG